MGSHTEHARQSLLTGALECWVVGHRGDAAVWPENTLPSLRAACEAGAMMIEFDVQQSADGKLFVFHDHTLERLCAEPLVASSLPWAVLSRKAVGRTHPQSVPIPLVEEVFATLQRSIFYNRRYRK